MVRTLHRYYGPGYERGPWPLIAAAIECLRRALPFCSIHYGSDGSDDAPEFTPTDAEHVWCHFFGPNGNAYRESFR